MKAMHRVRPDHPSPLPLHGIAASRALEQRAAAAEPAHALMQRAGLAVARLALALAPHARSVWIACGPGNNGGDGFEAAAHLQRWGKAPVVTAWGAAQALPPDAAAAHRRAVEAGVRFAPAPPDAFDLAIDAMFGLGAARPLDGVALRWRDAMAAYGVPVLAVDLPSGLDADTGMGESVIATHTLSLLTLKPGLFTGRGRDASGEVWLDDLGIAADGEPTAWLNAAVPRKARPHGSHKGDWGDVAVIGGAPGMAGAALLAGTAALHAGAGRVFVGLLDRGALGVDPCEPGLMFRAADALPVHDLHVACGCGGGEAVRELLPRVLSAARSLVLDADALNAISADEALQHLLRARCAREGNRTVLTPHPLEAARLLACDTQAVQADRLASAQRLAAAYGCTVVLKGSGTLIAAPSRRPHINPTGNARLATAGTGDVLAGMIAARLAAGMDGWSAACDAVHAHGQAADLWDARTPLTANALARAST
jgi:ADP-dependent NAD(P)H-hydrate dehydratase / NAD(P)H-hydrate epimerase